LPGVTGEETTTTITRRLFGMLAATALTGALSGMLSGTPALAETVSLKLNHNLPDISITGKSFEFLAKRVSELTNGDVAIRVFHNGQLGQQRESIELVQQGALEMAKSNAAEMEAFEPLFAVFNVPYIFKSGDHAKTVLKGEVGQAVLDAVSDNDMVGIGYLFEGARSFYANKPILSPADMAGMKMRVQPNPSAIRMVGLLGALPTPIAFGELYSALQQGVVDGAENSIGALTQVRHGEVSKHYSLNEHTMVPAVYFMSKAAWDQMTDDQKAAVRQAAQETFDFQYDAWAAEDARERKAAEDTLGVTFHDVDKSGFISATAPMIDEAKAASPEAAALIDQIIALGQ
jgi:tripartite ATP-independent transporter DctP family solute receptor